jgi:hypothetical protein
MEFVLVDRIEEVFAAAFHAKPAKRRPRSLSSERQAAASA